MYYSVDQKNKTVQRKSSDPSLLTGKHQNHLDKKTR